MPSPGRAATVARPAPLRALLALLATAFEGGLIALALGGPAALLRHERALALLAAWALGAVVLAVRAPVRTHDPVAVAPDRREVMPGLLALPLAAAPLGALGERLGVLALPGPAAIGWAGVALSALGLAIRIAAMTRLGSRFSPYVVVQRAQALETGGVYTHVRHPGYLGSWLGALGGALAFGTALGLVPVALLLPLLAARVSREEALLADHFGAAWTAYRSRTGAFLPRRH